ncbi:hypothetical protein VIB_002048 [Vibrio metschnikovii CIP 69.14]|nr:hypothetical protein VIB_002048 [Vibrio metschnikovii CIP 69.14]
MLDVTDLMVFGEGECKVRKNGKERHRTSRKAHLAVDAASQQIL